MDDILDRISKLLAKARGTTNEAEAALFAAKAAELLAKHNLDEEMLRQRDQDREQGPIGRHAYKVRVPDAWREYIVKGVARLYFCRTVWYPKSADPSRSWTFVGREHNAKVAMLMADYLMATVKRMAREHSPYKREQGGYRRGAGARLYNRLVELADAQRVVPANGKGDGTALMIIDEDTAIADFLGDIPTSKGKTQRYNESSVAGWEDAGKISLNTQVTETRASRLLA